MLLQELWADKSRADSRFNFRPTQLETDRRRDSLEASSLGGDHSAASSLGRQVNGQLGSNGLPSALPAFHNFGYQPQDQSHAGQNLGGSGYSAQQVGSCEPCQVN